jgi:hypothetical protein
MYEETNNPEKNQDRFELDRVAVYGRTLSEYVKMFHIDNDHGAYLKSKYKSILDCPSGASSFVAESTKRYGVQVVGCLMTI